MKLALTPEQTAQIERMMRHGHQLLARTHRDGFDGTNGETSGALCLVFTAIPSERLADVRAAIAGEPIAPKRKTKA